MTATEEMIARVGGAGEGELAALRQVLLAPERGQIRKILQRLDDPATRAAEIARVLPAAMGMHAAEDSALAETLLPMVRESLGEVLRQRPDLLVGAMRGALRDLVRTPWRGMRRLVRRRPRRDAEARVEQRYLLAKQTGELLEKRLRPVDMTVEWGEEEARTMASMVTYLLGFLREPEHLARYAALGQLRIERFTYGICAGAGVVLLSVIRGRFGVEEKLRESQELLIRVDREFVHGTGTGNAWLPPFEEAN